MNSNHCIRLHGENAEKTANRAIETGWWNDIPLALSSTYQNYPCKIIVNGKDIGLVPMRGSRMGVRQVKGGRANEWQMFVARQLGKKWASAYKRKPVFVLRSGKKDRWGPFGLNATCRDSLIDGSFAACFSDSSGLDEGLVSIRHAYMSGGLWLGSVCYYAESGGLRELADMVCETFELERMFKDVA